MPKSYRARLPKASGRAFSKIKCVFHPCFPLARALHLHYRFRPMTNELEQFRSQIDALDNQIIQLLKDRLHVVGQVADYKRSHFPHQFPIRAGREATMVRRIAEVFKGTDFAPAAAAQLWRLIIGTSTALEEALTISVYAPENDRDLFWLAREYFGPASTITKQPHINRVIGDVMDGKSAVGVVPTLSTNSSDSWWSHMIHPSTDAPRIFAHLPFFYTQENPKHFPSGLAFSRITPEDSGDDVSIYVMEVENDVSQHRLQTALTAENLAANWLGVASPLPNARQHLIEIKGFITPESPSFMAFRASMGATLRQAHFLGAYAVPFIIKD